MKAELAQLIALQNADTNIKKLQAEIESIPLRRAEIEKEFSDKMAQGWFAADISDKHNVLIREFDPDAEILLIPRVQGGL